MVPTAIDKPKLFPTLTASTNAGDIVLSPDGEGNYFVGEVVGDYQYIPNSDKPHRRAVNWGSSKIDRADMSQSLKYSTGSIGTVCQISKYKDELEQLIKGEVFNPVITSKDPTIEDPTVFALEKHLEDFLVANWTQTPLGKKYDIYKDEENFGQQFPTDTGPIDILAISKDKKEVLVVELKKGRASDSVVGQIQRYMGYVTEFVAEDNQQVKGVIIALDEDQRIKFALKVAPNIEFYRYEVKFDLIKEWDKSKEVENQEIAPLVVHTSGKNCVLTVLYRPISASFWCWWVCCWVCT